MNKLGNIGVAGGDLKAARQHFEQSLAIAQRLAEADPTSSVAQCDLIVGHVELAVFPGGAHHWGEAYKIASELHRTGRLAPRDLWMMDELRQRVGAAEQEQP